MSVSSKRKQWHQGESTRFHRDDDHGGSRDNDHGSPDDVILVMEQPAPGFLHRWETKGAGVWVFQALHVRHEAVFIAILIVICLALLVGIGRLLVPACRETRYLLRVTIP
jgi:hypothetical protein